MNTYQADQQFVLQVAQVRDVNTQTKNHLAGRLSSWDSSGNYGCYSVLPEHGVSSGLTSEACS
jgi:hypothetical protein